MSNAIVQVGPTEKLPSGKQLLRATLGGSLGSADVALIKSWAAGIEESVKTLAGKEIGKTEKVGNDKDNLVCVLIDIRQMETYSDPDIIMTLTQLMKEDSPYVYRTATFGGTALHEMIEGVIRTIADRTNMQNFKTEAEALEWLNA